MGEGTDRIAHGPMASDVVSRNGDTGEPLAPRELAQEIGGEIAVLREQLDTLVAELDRRRHEALDLKHQLRRHAFTVAVTGVAFVTAAAGFVWLGMVRARRRERVIAKAGRLRQAISRMIAEPERVAAEPTVPAKIVTAAANAAVAAVIKKLLERGVAHVLERREAVPERSEATFVESYKDVERVA